MRLSSSQYSHSAISLYPWQIQLRRASVRPRSRKDSRQSTQRHQHHSAARVESTPAPLFHPLSNERVHHRHHSPRRKQTHHEHSASTSAPALSPPPHSAIEIVRSSHQHQRDPYSETAHTVFCPRPGP